MLLPALGGSTVRGQWPSGMESSTLDFTGAVNPSWLWGRGGAPLQEGGQGKGCEGLAFHLPPRTAPQNGAPDSVQQKGPSLGRAWSRRGAAFPGNCPKLSGR